MTDDEQHNRIVLADAELVNQLLAELSDDVRDRLLDELNRGLDTADIENRFLSLVESWTKKRREQPLASSGVLTKLETELFAAINSAVDQTIHARWTELLELRDNDGLDDSLHEELTRIGDELERINAKRMQAIAQLAKLRGVEFVELCQQLGIASQQ